MANPDFLAPILAYPGIVANFIERIPAVPGSTDRAEILDTLKAYHEEELNTLGVPWTNLRRAQQVHGNKVALVGDIGTSYPIEGVDGLACCGVADCTMGIYVADCAAVWLYDTVNQGRALLHSGKKGTELNIVANGVKTLRSCCSAHPENIIAVISPCIRPPHYEIDIAAMIHAQLIAAGLPEANIHDSNLDTAADLDRFYSYRMEKGNTGRMFALFGRDLSIHLG